MPKEWGGLLLVKSVMGGEDHERKREILLNATEFIKKIYTESGVKELNKLEKCNNDVFEYLLTKQDVSELYNTLQEGFALQGPDIVELIEILAKSSSEQKVDVLIGVDSIKAYKTLELRKKEDLLNLIKELSALETDVIKTLLSEDACKFCNLKIVNIYDLVSAGDKHAIKNLLSKDTDAIRTVAGCFGVEYLPKYCNDMALVNLLTSKEVYENSTIDLELLKGQSPESIKLLLSKEAIEIYSHFSFSAFIEEFRFSAKEGSDKKENSYKHASLFIHNMKKALSDGYLESEKLKDISLKLARIISSKSALIGYKEKYFTSEQLLELIEKDSKDKDKIELIRIISSDGALIGYKNEYFTFDQLIKISKTFTPAEDGNNMVKLLVSKHVRHLYEKGEKVENLAELEAVQQIASYGPAFLLQCSLAPELLLSSGAIALYKDKHFDAYSLRDFMSKKMSQEDIGAIVSAIAIKNHANDQWPAKLREALFSKNALLGYLNEYFKPNDLDIKTGSGEKNYCYAHVQALTCDAAMKLYENKSLNIKKAVEMVRNYMPYVSDVERYDSFPQVHNVIFSENVIDLCFTKAGDINSNFDLSNIKTIALSLSDAFSSNENILQSFINNDEMAKALQSKEALIAYVKCLCTPAELYKIGDHTLVPDLINILTKIKESVNQYKQISDVADELAEIQMELEPGIESRNLQSSLKKALREDIVLSVKDGLLAALTGGVTKEVFDILTSREAFIQYYRYYLNDAILRREEISNDTRTIYSELFSEEEGVSPLMLKMNYKANEKSNKNTDILHNNANNIASNIDKINEELAKINEELAEIDVGEEIEDIDNSKKAEKMREIKARSDIFKRVRERHQKKKEKAEKKEEEKSYISDSESDTYNNGDEDDTSNNRPVGSWKDWLLCCRRKPKYRGFDGKLDGMSQEEITFNLDNIKRSAENSDIYIEKKILKENSIKATVSDWFKSHHSKFLGIAEVQNSQGEFHAVKVKCVKSDNGRIEIKIIDPMSASDSSSFIESENGLKDAVQSANFKATVSIVHEGVQDKNFGVCADLSLISISDEVCSNNKQFTHAVKEVHQYKHASNLEFTLDKAKILKALLQNDAKAIKEILDEYDPIHRTELLNIRNGVNGIVAAKIYLKDGSYMIDSNVDNVDLAIKSNIALAEKLYENANNNKFPSVVAYVDIEIIKMEAQAEYYLRSGIAFETLLHFMDGNSDHSDDYSPVFNSLTLDFTGYNSNNDVSSTFQFPIISGSVDIS